MKKIEHVSMVERKSVYYEALDGTYFDTQEECENYDKSAKCVITAKFKELVLKETNAYYMFPGGNEDNAAYLVKPETDHDIDTVRQFEAMIGLKYNSDYTPTVTKDMKGKVLVVITGYDNDWIDIRSIDRILEDITPKSDGGK